MANHSPLDERMQQLNQPVKTTDGFLTLLRGLELAFGRLDFFYQSLIFEHGESLESNCVVYTTLLHTASSDSRLIIEAS